MRGPISNRETDEKNEQDILKNMAHVSHATWRLALGLIALSEPLSSPNAQFPESGLPALRHRLLSRYIWHILPPFLQCGIDSQQ